MFVSKVLLIRRANLALAPLALLASKADAQQLRQIETVRGTNAFCVLNLPDGNYSHLYEGRFDRSDGTLRKMTSRLFLRHNPYEWAELRALVPISTPAYMERLFTASGSAPRTVIRVPQIKMNSTATGSRMVLTAGGREIVREIMLPFPILAAGPAEFEFGPETRAMFDVPFTLSFQDRFGKLYYKASFKPDPAFEEERGNKLVQLLDAKYSGLPAASAQLPKECRIERN